LGLRAGILDPPFAEEPKGLRRASGNPPWGFELGLRRAPSGNPFFGKPPEEPKGAPPPRIKPKKGWRTPTPTNLSVGSVNRA
jgi:hypothetical protein